MADYVTKTVARESIREARKYLRELEQALKTPNPDGLPGGSEALAGLCGAFYDTCEALGLDSDGCSTTTTQEV